VLRIALITEQKLIEASMWGAMLPFAHFCLGCILEPLIEGSIPSQGSLMAGQFPEKSQLVLDKLRLSYGAY
jgi:hypothetical protein